MNEERFCGNCKHVTPTEEQQDRMAIKISHRCARLNVVIFHGCYHPQIMRHSACPGKEV